MSDNSFKNSAHDLNNILTSIVNGIELLKQTALHNDDTDKIILGLEKSVNRAQDILHFYLTSNGSHRKNIEKVNVLTIIEEVINNFREEEKDLFKVNAGDNNFTVLIDSTDLFRMIQNLAKNALEAVDENGSIEISINNIIKNKRKLITIAIIDNGSGIARNNLSKIFEPTFSTKNKKQESGYGLASVKEKAEKYNGNIDVESNLEKTTFTLSLPLFENKKENSTNILIAEDDISVSEVLADLLKSNGYNVVIAKTGREAIIEMNKSLFDVLIIDKKMPEMDGIECIKSIRSGNPEIPIILASGSDIDLFADDLKYLNIGWLIKKPYNFPEILSALQKFNL